MDIKEKILERVPEDKFNAVENFNPAIYTLGLKYVDRENLLKDIGATEFEVSKFMAMTRQFDQKRKLLGRTLDGYKQTIDMLKKDNFKVREVLSKKYPNIKLPYFYAAKTYPINPPDFTLENSIRSEVSSEKGLSNDMKGFMLDCVNFMVEETRRRNNMICKLESHIKSLKEEKSQLAEILIQEEINAAANLPKVPERNQRKTILFDNSGDRKKDDNKISL